MVGTHTEQNGQVSGDYLLRGFPVGGEVVLPAETLIVDPAPGCGRDMSISGTSPRLSGIASS
jgi:hypothetical protein